MKPSWSPKSECRRSNPRRTAAKWSPLRLLATAVLSLALTAFSTTDAQQKSTPRTPPVRVPPADPACQPSATELRAVTRSARAANPTDTAAFLGTIDRAVGVDYGADPGAGTILLHSVDEIIVALTPRYGVYRLALAEQIRKMDPIESTPILNGHAVMVSPSQMDAPDFVKVVLQRGGIAVDPIANELKPTVFRNRMGASTMLHAGMIVFPCSAFIPDSIVTLTLIPESGSNITKTLTLGQMRALR